MAIKDCIDALKESMKDTFSSEDIESVSNKLLSAAARAEDKSSDLATVLNESRQQIESDFDQESTLKEYRFYDKLAKKKKVMSDITRNINRRKPVFQTLKTKETGIAFQNIRGRFSRELQIRTWDDKILDGLKTKLKDSNLLDTYHSKDFESDLAKSIATGEKAGEEIDPKVPQIGKIINELYDMLDKEYARRGIFIKKLKGRLVKNYHDATKMQETADTVSERVKNNSNSVEKIKNIAFNRWFKFTKPLLNIRRSFGDHMVGKEAGLKKLMREDYNNFTNSKVLNGHSGNIANRLSKRRVYSWNNEQDALKYIQKFGPGTLHQAIERELRDASKNFASIDSYGHDRDSFIDSIKESASKIKAITDKEDINKSIKEVKDIANAVDGSLDASNSSIAHIAGNIRAAISIAKLGLVVLKSFPDIALHTNEVRRVHGGFLSSAANVLKDLATPFSDEEKIVLADLLKTYQHLESGNLSRFTFSNDGQVGLMSKLQRLEFKLNLMHKWDKGNQTTLAATLARHLAINKDFSFKQMIERDKKFGEKNVNILKSYDISGDEWDAVRKVPSKMADKKEYLLPESSRDIPDSDIKKIFKNEGRQRISSDDIDKKREDIEFKLRMYFKDRADHVILRPSAYTKFLLFGNTPSGTMHGQVIRMMMQFKAYSAAYIEKPVGSLLRGGGAESVYESIFKYGSRGDYAGMASMIAYSTILGYIGNQAANLAEGKGISAPTDLHTFEEALATGGGLSFLGDLIFGNTKFGGSTLETVFGPFFSELGDVINEMFASPIQGQSSFNKVTNAGFHFVKGNTPYLNVFYIKWFIDYLILNRMQDMIKPGYSRRKINELKKEGRSYILPPIAGE